MAIAEHGLDAQARPHLVKRTEEILGRELSASPLELGVALRLAEGLDSLRTAAS